MNTPPSTAPSALSPQIVVLNLEEAIERMGDKEIYLEIARYFAAHLEQTLEHLRAALEDRNMEEATRLAHSLKGNCATVGADALREECLKLEHLCRAGNRDAARNGFDALVPKLLGLRERLNSL